MLSMMGARPSKQTTDSTTLGSGSRCEIFCLVYGDSAVFSVCCSLDASVSQLKKLIVEENKHGLLPNVDAKDLVLWKLNEPELVAPSRTLALRIQQRGEISQFAVELEPTDRLSTVYPQHPPYGYLHIIAQLQISSCITSPSIAETWSPRRDTVRTLYNKLRGHRLVQVRGTPASGKTTLLSLLHTHIMSQDDAAAVYVIESWPKDNVPPHYMDRIQRQCSSFSYHDGQKNKYLLFDNGQETYWDGELWENFFKSKVQQGVNIYVILFCSFGSPSERPVEHQIGTPLSLLQCARVSLRADSNYEDGHGPIGLLFTRPEFDEAIERHRGPDRKAIRLEPRLQDMLFDWTAGHAGAVTDILRRLTSQRRQDIRSGATRTLEHFLNDNPIGDLFNTLATFQGVARGLPRNADIQDPAFASIFRDLLFYGSIENDATKGALQKCFMRGWVHSDVISGVVHYAFPSPLHQIYLAWKLIPPVVECSFVTVIDMAIATIKQFKTAHLRSPARVGAAFNDRPVEACYQDEFYRALFQATGGSIIMSPEYSSSSGACSGRIDFFVPVKRWGLELLREGSELGEHSSRFGLQGPYGQWLTSGDMEDYIILDFRTSPPQKKHPNIAKLFHVVFQNNFSTVVMLNNMLEQQDSFVLLAV